MGQFQLEACIHLILAFNINYNIKVRNDQNRSSSLNFSFSFDNSTFIDISSANYSSPLSSDSNATWVTNNKNVDINNISIPPNHSFYIRWSTSDQGGSGSRDEIAIDDIAISATANSNNCEEPNNQPTNLSFANVTSNSISGDFSWTVADKFLVIQTTTSNLNSLPSDGSTYSSGQTIGNGLVISYNNQTTFNSLGLQESTTYYYHIFSANDNCNGGPDYLTDSPLTGNIQTTTDSNSDYYNGMNGLTCESLKTALHLLIDNHTELSYGALWTLFQTSDDHLNDSGNQTIVWDMYTDNPTTSENEFLFVTNQCGTYSVEGDCYNREHSFPKSWWGGSTSPPQYTDAFHLIPVDGYVNGIRSNLPYSEVQSGTETYVSGNGTTKGSSSISIPGYNGSVFEPIDAYKGDLARNYFYMATRYEDVIAGWKNSTTESNVVLDGSSFQVFEPWMLNMLMTWHNNDPVSTKEIERNDEIFLYQGNRNPFIDHPEYVDLIWGNGCGSDLESPTDPSNLTASNILETTVDLAWSASSDNVGVDHYNIYQDGVLVATSSSSSFVATGLTANSTYNYSVNAEDAAGNISGNSNQISVTTSTGADNQAPTIPSTLTVSNVTEDTAILNWNASTDNVGVIQYNVYQNGSLIASTPNTNFNIGGLTSSTTYLFYINAEDAAGNISGNSNQISITTDSPSGPMTIHECYFETGWDGWIDGGSDCFRHVNTSYAYEGNTAIRLRDNSGNGSTMTSPTFDLSSFANVDFDFYFKAISMENGENFIVSYDNGSGWIVIGDYARGTDFNNNTFYNVAISLSDSDYNFTSNSRFKIQCDASVNNDRVYIDQVIITGNGSTSSQIINTEIEEIELFVFDKNNNTQFIDNVKTKVDNKFENSDIVIYPNPTSDILNISNVEGISIIQIYNMAGQKVFDSLNKLKAIDVHNFESGMYHLTMRRPDGELTILKFIKN